MIFIPLKHEKSAWRIVLKSIWSNGQSMQIGLYCIQLLKRSDIELDRNPQSCCVIYHILSFDMLWNTPSKYAERWQYRVYWISPTNARFRSVLSITQLDSCSAIYLCIVVCQWFPVNGVVFRYAKQTQMHFSCVTASIRDSVNYA